MNIALTYFCNQKCAYCFGKDAMSISRGSPEAREISLSNLKKVMSFMKASRKKRFKMIGGEPTLHSHFEELYNVISNNGFSIQIFSNGVIDKTRVDFLKKQNSLVDILLNIRKPREYTQKEWGKIEYTLSQVNNKITLSFRVYQPDFDPVFLFDLIDQYRLPRLINWAISCPSLVSRNAFIRLEDHERVVERMVEFSRESKKRRIRWTSDLGFILCAFDGGKLEALKENVGFVPITNCFPPVEVAPDLRVFRCFGLASKSGPNLRLTDFKNLNEAEKHFFDRSLIFKKVGALDRCLRCEHIVTQRCGGGCMAHILKRFPRYKNVPAIFKGKEG